MSMRISRIQIHNFRNFKDLDLEIGSQAVIIGDNKIGKSNLLYALRLILDPSLPDSVRQLRREDFWDGLPRPLSITDKIWISIDFTDFEGDPSQLALLGAYPIEAFSYGQRGLRMCFNQGRVLEAAPTRGIRLRIFHFRRRLDRMLELSMKFVSECLWIFYLLFETWNQIL